MKTEFLKKTINFHWVTGIAYPELPRLKGHFLWGRLGSFLTSDGPLENFLHAGELAVLHPKGMSYFWLGVQKVLFVTKPEDIKKILTEHAHRVSSQIPLKLFQLFFGSNIFVDEDELWEKKKAIYAKWLNRKAIMNTYEHSIYSGIEFCYQHLISNSTQWLNLQTLCSKFTLHVVLASTMPFLAIDPELIQKLSQYLNRIDENLFTAKNLFKWNLPPLIRNLISKDANPEKIKHQLQAEFYNDILPPLDERVTQTESFIKDIWALSDHHLKSFSSHLNDIYGDANIALIAGVETTASTLQFLIKLLARYPEYQERVRQERSLKEQELGQLSIHDLIEMPCLDALVKETLRLYAPAPAVLRHVKEKFILNEIPVNPGTLIIFSPLVTHQLKAVWGDDATEFRPERFMHSDLSKSDAFLPFSRGSRACIGRDLALIEIKAFISELLKRFNIEVDQHDFQISLTKGALKPKLLTNVRFIPK